MTAAVEVRSRLLQGYLFAGVTVMIWAGFVIVSRLGGSSGVLTPYDIAALRTATAALALSPWWVPRLLFPALRKLKWTQALSFALLAGISYPLLAYSAFACAPASHGAVLISGLLPFFTSLFAWLLLRELPTPRRLLGLALIFGGIGLLIAGNIRATVAETPDTVWLGDLMFVGASAIWALFTALLKRWQVRAFDVMLGVVAMSAILYLPVYFAALPRHLAQASMHEILLQAVFQGLVVVCCAMFTYAKATEYLGSTQVAVIMSLVPAIGALMAIPMLNEPLTHAAAIGVALVSMGALIGALARPGPQGRSKPVAEENA